MFTSSGFGGWRGRRFGRPQRPPKAQKNSPERSGTADKQQRKDRQVNRAHEIGQRRPFGCEAPKCNANPLKILKIYRDHDGCNKSTPIPVHKANNKKTPWFARSDCFRPITVLAVKTSKGHDKASQLHVWGVYSGSRHWSPAGSRKGIEGHAFDIFGHDGNNFVNSEVVKWMCKEIKKKKPCLAIFVLPCHSSSRAPRPGVGFGPLRDDGINLRGYPDLRPCDVKNVKVGNIAWINTFKMTKACIKYQVPWILENPKSSRTWLMWHANRLEPPGASTDVASSCQHGTRLRKDTKSMHMMLPSLSNNLKQCHPKSYKCSRSGPRHFQLCGVDPEPKRFWIVIAKFYPPKLCSHMWSFILQDIQLHHRHPAKT